MHHQAIENVNARPESELGNFARKRQLAEELFSRGFFSPERKRSLAWTIDAMTARELDDSLSIVSEDPFSVEQGLDVLDMIRNISGALDMLEEKSRSAIPEAIRNIEALESKNLDELPLLNNIDQ